ncbi:MAG: UDP-N-acetylglucosamine pyrophosphorylase [Verrucomicrobia bacterium]|nr:UDP-N-acetylglucosamine pyrophosphorylase [Verrucomicrobiota bacterium]MCH8510204.1 UDP-N-acetylglucosamine pyrophosphorylase [Kiritimatiellia bacterium]
MDIPPPYEFPHIPHHAQLLDRGVVIPHPASVFIDSDVDQERIAPGVVLHPGTRLSGETLSIGPGCVIGGETPATVVDCQLGHDVALKGGFYQGSVFLDESGCGSSAHVRPGCLLEEEASIAHAVGLKQTILLPFVTLGSLINFCDVLMAGGTSRKDHGEVGSSFIHFNFTPHGDKATPTLIGDVPRGVLLDQPPVFLGGQGGIVGPVSVEFGVVQAAGSICREDMDCPGHLYRFAGAGQTSAQPYAKGRVRDAERRLQANLRYIGNLFALRLWYQTFRKPLMSADPYRERCRVAAVEVLREAAEERVRQLDKWVKKLDEAHGEAGGDAGEALEVARRWPLMHEALRLELEAESAAPALAKIAETHAEHAESVPLAVKGLNAEERKTIFSRLNTEVQRALSIADRAQ